MKKSRRIKKQGLIFEELDPRLLLSADPLAVFADVSANSVHELVISDSEANPALNQVDIIQPHSEQSGSDQSTSSARKELVIIDSRAPNYQQLYNDAHKVQSEGREVHVIVLDAHRDGIKQISEALERFNNLDAVHIVSHSDAGQLNLGTTQLNNTLLKQRSDDIAQWKQAFSEDGDVLIYGCNLASDAEGTVLIDELSQLTGTDIAASDDLTGDQLKGGDWDLEYQSGEIETNIAFSEDVQQNWQGILEATAESQPTISVEPVQENVSYEEQHLIDEQEQEAALIKEASALAKTEEEKIQEAAITEELRQEIVFIDESVTDYQSFIDDLQSNSNSSATFEIIVLDSETDGIDQISNVLSAYEGVDAIHVISHGDDGTIKLGNTCLNANNIADYDDSLTLWGNALDENADILIYGCNLAESEAGEHFVNQLASLTSADVAASDDLTGNESLGGDWVLEYQQGNIETDIAVSENIQQKWSGILADTTTNLVAHYSFDIDGHDSSGNLNDVTLQGNAIIDTNDGTDKVGEGKLSLDGVDDYVDLTSNLTSFNGLANGTISAWINVASGDITENTIFDIGDGVPDANYVSVFVENGFLTVSIKDGGTEMLHVTSTATINDGAWHHISFSSSASGNALYIDGAQLTGGAISYAIGTSSESTFIADLETTTNATIGAFNLGTIEGEFNGLLDDVRVYSEALSSGVVTALANENISNTYIVSSTADSGPGSLRQAILDANANDGVTDTITFNIGVDGSQQTISLLTALDPIIDTVIIDGFSQYGALTPTTPLIELNGSGVIGGDGIHLDTGSEGSTLQGLIINNFDGNGIQIESDDNVISGNYIGTTAAGTAASGNGGYGINVLNAAGNTIGGNSTIARNVISGNVSDGIMLYGASTTGTNVQGNYIGIDAAGTSVIANTGDGIVIDSNASNNIIGGVSAAERNVISGNGTDGIEIMGGASSNTVSANYIGTDYTGDIALGNSRYGVVLYDGATSNTIGGSTAGAGNVISANGGNGVVIDGNSGSTTDNNIISGNYIGTDKNGTGNLGNGNEGIWVHDGADNNTIGGVADGAGNIIAYNISDGVELDANSGIGNAVLRNSVFSNGGLGIDINPSGVLANDIGDGDTGANNLQNYPVLSTANTSGTQITITGSFNSQANSYYRIEFFASGSGDASGNGEAETYLGYANIATDGSGNATINVVFSASVANGAAISATATKSNISYSTFTDTSEFAANVIAAYVNDAPVSNDDPSSYSSALLNLNPLSYWRLGEAAGTTATDLGSTGNDGVYSGAVTLDTSGALMNDADTSVEFDGSTGHVDVGNFNVAGSGITLTAWINSDDYDLLEQRVISKASGSAISDHTWMLSTIDVGGEERLRFRLEAGGVTETLIATSGVLTEGQWHHTTATYDAATGVMILYLDGVEVGSMIHSVGGAVATNAKNVSIGANPDDEYRPFDGRIDEVAVFDKALTSSEIFALSLSDQANVFSVNENNTLDVNAANGVLSNDGDLNGDSLTAVLVSGVSNGTITLSVDGSFSYTPDADWSGTDSFTYTANDGNLDSSVATVTITVNSVNSAPVNTSPIAHWTFDTDASDSSGNNYHGTLTDDAAIDTADATDKVGEGKLSLDGTDDHVDFSDHVSSLSALTEGSISLWFNTTDTGLNSIFGLTDSNSSNDSAYIDMSNGLLLFGVESAGVTQYAMIYITPLNDGNWHHVSITADGDGNKFYIDGVQILPATLIYANGSASNTEFFADVNNVDTISLGAYTDSLTDVHFNGLIDDVQIHDYALTSGQVATLATVNDAPTFGIGNGVVTTDISGSGSSDAGTSTTVQADGKILVAGHYTNGANEDFLLTRYNSDGSLDITFGGGDGKVTTAVGTGDDLAKSVTVQADGKILVAGYSYNGANNDFALTRYNSDGSLDLTFGGGDGKVTTSVLVGAGNDQAQGVVLQDDGKILIAGTNSNAADSKVALIRYNIDGSLDTTFGGGDGIVATSVGTTFDNANSITLQADGKILVAGGSSDGSTDDFGITRYYIDGTLDTTFGGGDGKVTTAVGTGNDYIYSITVQADGKILAAGSAENGSGYTDFALTRYTINGVLDTSFGVDTNGIVTTSLGVTSYDQARSITVLASGDILVGGNATDNVGNLLFALTRYTSSGVLDTTFGEDNNGIVITDVGTGYDEAGSLAVQGDGKILLAGYTEISPVNYDIALVRYNSDGTLDTTFDPLNSLNGNPAFIEGGVAVVLDSGVDLIDSNLDTFNGGLGDYHGTSLTLIRDTGATAEDVFSFNDANGITLAGSNLVKNSQVIASFDTTSTSGQLVINFTNANGETPTSADVDNILHQITYANSSNAPPVSAQINWTFNDGNSGEQGSGSAQEATGSTTVSITAVNDAPTATNLNVGVFYTEDTPRNLIDIVVTDDNANTTVTLTLSDVGAGSLATATSGTVTSTFIGGVWTASGAVADVNALLAGVTFNPTQSYSQNFTIAISVSDGIAPAITGTHAMTAISVNDAPTFGIGNGIVTTDISSGHDAAYSVTVQADGKILIAGTNPNGVSEEFAITRYNTDGTLDTSFGNAGIVTTDIGTGDDVADDITVQADGKILVTGYHYNGTDYDFAVTRYNTDGTLDAGFGNAGIVITDVSASTDLPYSITLQADGKILVAGQSYNGISNVFTIIRYNSDGSLDTSFDSDGIATTSIGAGGSSAYSVTVQSDGKILLAGDSYNGSSIEFTIARYNSNGSLDTSFDSDGIVTTDINTGTDVANSITVQTDGKILVAGYSDNGTSFEFAITRYNSNGSLDISFDSDGIVTTDISTGSDIANSISVQTDGKILVAGDHYNGSSNEFAITRYNSDGSLDTSFGNNGIVTTDISTGSDVAKSLTIQADGKFLVAGSSFDGSGNKFAVTRYNTDGTLDSSFNMNTVDGSPTFTEGGAAVVLDSDVLVTDVELDALNGGNGDYSGSSLTLIRDDAANADDILSFIDGSGITLSNGNLIKNSQVIATFDTTTTAGELLISFTNANGETPTSTDVENILSQISYANSSDAPPASAQINWIFNDGNSGAQGSGGSLEVAGSTTVTIIAINDAPIITAPINYAMVEDDAVTLPITVNDVDADATIINFGLITHDSAILNLPAGTGAIITANTTDGITINWGIQGTLAQIQAELAAMTFTPVLNFTGATTVDLAVNDGGNTGSGGSLLDNLTITINVSPVNDAPTATNLSTAESYIEDSALNLTDIVVSDIDSANATVTLTLSDIGAGTLNTATSGAVTSSFVGGVWIATGAIADINTLLAGITFTPTLNYDSNFSIATSVDDGVAAAITGTKVMTATAVNDAATATNLNAAESYTEDSALNLTDIVVSDVDSANATVTLTLSDTGAGTLNTATSGAVTSTFVGGVWTATGAVANVNALLAGVTFNPTLNYDLNFNITTSVGDGIAAPVTGVKIMTAVPANDVPVFSALNGTPTFTENGPAVVLDADVTILDAELNAADNYANASFTLRRNSGPDSEDLFSETGNLAALTEGGNLVLSGVTIGTVTSNSAGTLVLTFNANATQARVNETLQSIAYSNSNDAPPVSVDISWIFNDNNAGSQGFGGAAIANGNTIVTIFATNDASQLSGLGSTLAYTEGDSATILDSTITITDVDDTNLEFANISISGGRVNSEDLLDFTAASGITGSYNATSGILSLAGTATLAEYEAVLESITYQNTNTANPNTGNRTITWTVHDGSGNSADFNSTITVAAQNDAPVANNDSASVNEGQSVNIDLATNDTDADNMLDLTSIVVISDPSNGAVVINANGTVDYTHDGSETTADSFTYTILDASGLVSNTATVSLIVNPINDAPTAQNDTPTAVNEGGVKIFDLAANDSDAENALDLNSITIMTAPSSGALTVNGDGTVTYTHNGSETLTDSFSYIIADISGLISNAATVNITVNSVNDAPIAGNDIAIVEQFDSVAINLSATDNDVDDGLDLNSLTITSGPANGTLIINGDGTVIYNHNGSNTLSDSFSYTISDISGLVSNVATVNITINAVNAAPTSSGIADVTVNEDSANTVIDLNSSFDDRENLDSELIYSIIGNSNIGLFNIANIDVSGQLILDYAANLNGSAQLSIRATDTEGESVDTLFTVTVTPTNDVPVLVTNTGIDLQTSNAAVITGSHLSVNDIDNVNSETIYSITSIPTSGDLLLNGIALSINGSFTQADLDSGRVSYQSNGTSAGDSFGFSVIDASGGVGASSTFNMVVQLAQIAPTEDRIDIDDDYSGDNEKDTAEDKGVDDSELIDEKTDLDNEFIPVGGSVILKPPVLTTIPPTETSVLERDVLKDVLKETRSETTIVDSNVSTLAEIQLQSLESFWQAIDVMKQEMSEAINEKGGVDLRTTAVESSGVVLTAGVVAWVLRSGALLTSLMTTIPMWKGYDPLTIIAYKDDEEEEEEENLPVSPSEQKEYIKKKSLESKVESIFNGSSLNDDVYEDVHNTDVRNTGSSNQVSK